MSFSAVLGALVGLLGIVPLFVSSRKSVNVVNSSYLTYTSLLLIALLASLLILAAPIVICALAAQSELVPFSIAEVVVYLVGIIAFGISVARRR